MRNTFADNLYLRSKEDNQVLLITGDLGFGLFDKYSSDLPDQFINSGIAEQAMMSMAAGLASMGYRPFVYSIGNFPTMRCLEQIRNDVCYMDNPVTIVSVGAGMGYGNLGYTHHAIEDLAVLRGFSNLMIYSPASPKEVAWCIEDILQNNSPAYLRLGKGGEKEIHNAHLAAFSGPLEIVTGKDGYIVFTGGIASRVFEAQKRLNEQGVFPSIYSMPKITRTTIKKMLEITRSSFLLTVEEHNISGGFGSWILEESAVGSFDTVIRNCGLRNNNIALLGSHEYLLDNSGFIPEEIVDHFLQVQQKFDSH